MENQFKPGFGSFNSVLKRIGSSKSKLFCVGQDPLTQSGVIVANGKLVSSKILDITIKPADKDIATTDKDKFLNKVTVKYIDSVDKLVRKHTFDILNEDALLMVLSNIMNLQKISEKQSKIDEKLQNIDEILSKNDEKMANFSSQQTYIQSQINDIENDDITAVTVYKNEDSDFNTVEVHGAVNGEESIIDFDIIDKDKFEFFKHHVNKKLEELTNKVNSLMYHDVIHHNHDMIHHKMK